MDGKELLLTRRSVRSFIEKPVSDEILQEVLEICRYAPTSKNSQAYYFVVIRDSHIRNRLAGLRGRNSAPIGKATLAVAICSDPAGSQRHVQDGCIAAYHFSLAAWHLGLGTCWIGGMDRDDVKEALNIPKEHYVATVTPLAYPGKTPTTPARRPAAELVKGTL